MRKAAELADIAPVEMLTLPAEEGIGLGHVADDLPARYEIQSQSSDSRSW